MLTEKAREKGRPIALQKRREKKRQRQTEVKRLFAQGKSKAEIARMLDVNYETILRDFREFRQETPC